MNETIYERQYLGRGQIRIQAKQPSLFLPKVLLLLTILAILINLFFVNPWWKTVTIQNQQTAMLSDKQQEALYCAQWYRSQVEVRGGNTEAIRSHCARFL